MQAFQPNSYFEHSIRLHLILTSRLRKSEGIRQQPSQVLRYTNYLQKVKNFCGTRKRVLGQTNVLFCNMIEVSSLKTKDKQKHSFENSVRWCVNS